MERIETLEKKISGMVEKYNSNYKNEDSMSNDLLDMAEGIMNHQSMLIKLYKKQIIKENQDLKASILEWWKEHAHDISGEYGEFNVYEEEPNFVTLAKK